MAGRLGQFGPAEPAARRRTARDGLRDRGRRRRAGDGATRCTRARTVTAGHWAWGRSGPPEIPTRRFHAHGRARLPARSCASGRAVEALIVRPRCRPWRPEPASVEGRDLVDAARRCAIKRRLATASADPLATASTRRTPRGRRRRGDAGRRRRPAVSYVYRFRAESGRDVLVLHAHQAPPPRCAGLLRRARDRALPPTPRQGDEGRPRRRLRAHARRDAARELDSTASRSARGPARARRCALRVINTDSIAAALRHRRHAVRGRRDRRHRLSSGRRRFDGRTLVLAAGGRYDVAFTMPPSPGEAPAVEGTFRRAGAEPDGTAGSRRQPARAGPSSTRRRTAVRR